MSVRASDEAARLRQLFDHVKAGIAVAGSDGRFVHTNPAFQAMVGMSAEELASTDFLSLTHPDDRRRNLELIEDLRSGRRASFRLEKRYLTPNRGPVWARADVTMLRDPDTGGQQFVATVEDITTQKNVEARLEQSQSLLRIAGEVGRVGGWAIDADPVRLYWSDEVHDLAGYPRGQTPPLDEALDLYPPGERERMAAAVETCLEHATPFDIECLFTPPRAGRIWVRVVGRPMLRADGSVERIQGAIIDISEQKRAQREQERLAERLTTTMESITDALYTVDTKWRFTYVNRRAQEILERDAHELIGRSIWEAFPATVGSPLDVSFRKALDEGRTVVLEEYYYEPLDRYFGVNTYPSEQGLAVYFRDVTAARATRIELEERGARLAEQAALLDEAQDAIVVRDLDGRVRFWNRSAERIYGWSAQEAIGRRMHELLELDPAVYAEAQRRLLDEGSWVDEVAKTAKDGRVLAIEARWTLVRDEGNPTSVLGIDTDITQRKRMEQQFLRVQRMESLGKLAGGIAHDLNNALAPIALAVQLLRTGEEDPDRLRLLDLVDTSAQHGGRMVEQVLSFARGVDGRREPVSVPGIVDEVGRIAADTFPKSISVEARTPPELWQVIGDPTQLQQVLMNLCVNARDAMPDGGTLTLTAANTGLAEQLDQGGAHVTICVTDTGVGIPDDVLENMFEPFFTTKPRGEGSGLGLSTSAVIVESLGGRIEVTTEPAAGTTFAIHLPAHSPDPVGEGPEPQADPRTGRGELVLVVDDEENIREIARLTLERSGYRVLLAGDGEQAMSALKNDDAVAMVLTDLMMPVMDGYELIEQIRRVRNGIPIVASSGLNTSEAAERSLRLGAQTFLAKPYDTATLLRSIGEVLESTPR